MIFRDSWCKYILFLFQPPLFKVKCMFFYTFSLLHPHFFCKKSTQGVFNEKPPVICRRFQMREIGRIPTSPPPDSIYKTEEWFRCLCKN